MTEGTGNGKLQKITMYSSASAKMAVVRTPFFLMVPDVYERSSSEKTTVNPEKSNEQFINRTFTLLTGSNLISASMHKSIIDTGPVLGVNPTIPLLRKMPRFWTKPFCKQLFSSEKAEFAPIHSKFKIIRLFSERWILAPVDSL